MEQETQKNYIQLQVTVKESGGQGIQGSCSLHSFLTNFFLSNLNDSLKSEWPVRREVCTHPIPPHAHQVHQSFSLGQMFGQSGFVRGQESITESSSLEQLVLTLNLSVITSRLHSVRFRPASDNETEDLATSNPFPPPVHISAWLLLITQELGYWALGRQIFLCSFSLLNHLPSFLQREWSPKNRLLQPCCTTKPQRLA